MSERTYQEHEVEEGTHILIFREENGAHLFERKVFVPISDYNPENFAAVLDVQFRTLHRGSFKNVADWLQKNADNKEARMVAVGKDFQLLSIVEFIFHHG